MTTPTLIDLPPPPSDPVTPSDMGPYLQLIPLMKSSGTPNSGTTSLSALSTTAIKDGHQGHRHRTRHTHRSSSASDSSTTTLDAERADRISRLAGLERVATTHSNPSGTLAPTNPQQQGMSPFALQPPGFFDHLHPQFKERSTVGSASATGSIGGRTTWASGSDFDRMTDDHEHDHDHDQEHDDGVSSVGGLSDEGNSSLVGFGEGAGSTISGPVSTAAARMSVSSTGATRGVGSSPATTATTTTTTANRPQGVGHTSSSSYLQPNPALEGVGAGAFAAAASPSPAGSSTPEPPLTGSGDVDARMVDGMTYDADVVDTAARRPELVGGGLEGKLAEEER
ncbi:hypothetical protein FQN50_001626 [Emmonsiellopsis sp. PD_5]|nr:hypothetical protein FQN50_001626 [Emmonsiellopsis sp. PD_5]